MFLGWGDQESDRIFRERYDRSKYNYLDCLLFRWFVDQDQDDINQFGDATEQDGEEKGDRPISQKFGKVSSAHPINLIYLLGFICGLIDRAGYGSEFW